MRLKTVRALNYLNLRTKIIDIPASANLVLIAGNNGDGKTALLEGIRFALTGELPRGLGFKKDVPSLITDGEKEGLIEVSVIGADSREHEYRVSLKTGQSKETPLTALGALAVSPQRFTDLDAKGRRKALFQLYGLSLSADAVTNTLIADGHDEARVAKIKAALPGGFDAASRRAKELQSEARGAWQVTTGEAYGSSKADGWKAPVPTAVDAGDIPALAAQLDEKKSAAASAVKHREELCHTERQHKENGVARQEAERLPALTSQLAVIDEKIAAAEAKRDAARAAQSSSGGWTCPCPACGVILLSKKAGDLVEHTPSSVSPPQAGAQVAAAEAELSALRGERARQMSAIENSRAYKLQLERLPDRPSSEVLQDAINAADEALREVDLVTEELAEAKAARDALLNASQATAAAARYHADVAAYGELAEAVQGLPAKYLAAVLEKVNEVLDRVSHAFGRRVVLGEDMEPRYGTTPYAMCSESQRWRVELALGLAFAYESGGPVLMDRFDMVQPSDRGEILQLLAAQDTAQVVLAATLKAKPVLPEGMPVSVHWLGDEA